DEVRRIRSEVGREPPLRRADQSREPTLATQERHRLPLQLELPPLVLPEHRPRACAEGAVVQKDEVLLEQEEVAQRYAAFSTRSSSPPPSIRTASVSALIHSSWTRRSRSLSGSVSTIRSVSSSPSSFRSRFTVWTSSSTRASRSRSSSSSVSTATTRPS